VKGVGRKNILVLRYRFIGDTILTVPFLRNLRRAEPDAYIAWVVAPGSSEVVQGIPYVDELIYWDPPTIHADSRGKHRTLGAKMQFIKELRAKRFDKVYVLKRSLSSAIMGLLTGARERVGFDTEGRGLLLTKRVPYLPDIHEVRNFLAVLEADGVPIEDDHLEAWLSPEEEAFAERFLVERGVQPGEVLTGIHPFAANPTRAWHEENFAQLANALQKQYGGRVLLFGGKGDRELGESMSRRISPEPLMAVGSTTLRQTMALLARCSLLVCNDSGIMHLAASLQVPLVALFGPQSPARFGPWGKTAGRVPGVPCSPCKQKFFTECAPSGRGRPECLEAISVQDVVKEIEGFLSGGK